MAAVALESISYTYPGAPAPVIDALSLDVASGEGHAVLGASGAGKTTLLNLMSGILKPDSGRLFIDGQDVSALDGYARGVAQVFQFPVLYDTLTVRDNLRFPLRRSNRSNSELDARVRRMASELGIEEVLDQKPPQLDLFQKQLTAVGKALVRPDLKLVLLDEPLTSVAPGLKWRMRGALKRLREETGLTMIYVTHDQTEALTFAERVSVLGVDGIVQTDTPERLYAAPVNEYVGHFVGSPGMNFIPASLIDRDAERIGFRSEWARVGPISDRAGVGFGGRVVRVTPTGTFGEQPWGHVAVGLEDGNAVIVEGFAGFEARAPVWVALDRYVAFNDGVRVSEVEL